MIEGESGPDGQLNDDGTRTIRAVISLRRHWRIAGQAALVWAAFDSMDRIAAARRLKTGRQQDMVRRAMGDRQAGAG